MINTDERDRASIPPVTDGGPRPLWSVMIPVFNCAALLRESLASVLDQDPGPEVMQIEVVDDHSTEDDPEAVVRDLGYGRVSFYRQPANVGHVRNFETCLRRSRGRLIHLLHGDDRVRDGFYAQMEKAFDTRPDIGAAFCRHIYMDDEGHWQSLSPLERREPGVLENWLRSIAAAQRLATPAMVVRREIYERLGAFDRRFACAGEDWEMWVRIAAHYPVWFEPEPLATYRMKRSGALTGGADGIHRLVEDMLRATEIIEGYLPEHLPAEEAAALTRRARRTYAGWALEALGPAVARGRAAEVAAQVRQAYGCNPSIGTLGRIASRCLEEGWRQVRKYVGGAWRKRGEWRPQIRPAPAAKHARRLANEPEDVT